MYGRGRRGGGRGGGGNFYFMMLVMQLLNRIQRLERKPPITLGLMASMAALFYYGQELGTAKYWISKFALCPAQILLDGEWKRLLASGFLHADQWHLYHNMASLLWKGMHLEFSLGPYMFTQLVVMFLISSHCLFVAISWTLAEFTTYTGPYYGCAVGFSAVLFAMKVVLNKNSPPMTSLYGFQLPTKYASWLELVLLHYMVPQSSLLGHVCGIIVGYVYVYWNTLFTSLTRWIPNQTGTFTGAQNVSGSSRESDEAMARRLQKEEQQRAANATKNDEKTSTDSDMNDLRRRRLQRLGL